MRCLLNERKIASIKVGSCRQEYWDTFLPGFGMRVTKAGQKTFFVMCREQGKQRRLSLGRYPIITLSEARNAARHKLKLITEGIPLEEKPQKIITLEEVFKSFIEIYAKQKTKDWRRTELRLNKSLIKELGSKDIRNVSREDIISLLDKIVARNAPIQANRVFANISKFFKWCAERGYIENNPVQYVSKPAKENSRDRVLSDQELYQVWEEARNMPYPFGPIFQLLILTGQRKGEVTGMRWSEIDLAKKIWVLPKERAKNGHAHSVPLSDEAVRILGLVPRFLHSDIVFTTTGKTAVSGFGKVKSRLDMAAGVQGWTIHDIRRTVASGMAKLKVSPHIVEKILNHVSGTFSGVAGVYNRYGYDDEKRDALEVWENFIVGNWSNGKINNAG